MQLNWCRLHHQEVTWSDITTGYEHQLRQESLHFTRRKIYSRYVWPKENPGQPDIHLWTAVIQGGYLLSGKIPVTLGTFHTQGHDRRQWIFNSASEALSEDKNGCTWLRYKKKPLPSNQGGTSLYQTSLYHYCH